jgi:hypothetical protein
MGRVRGDREASASSTNSCGTGLRRLTRKGEASDGTRGELRRGFGMRTTEQDYGISAACDVANGREGLRFPWHGLYGTQPDSISQWGME